jgi:hypothetical protein
MRSEPPQPRARIARSRSSGVPRSTSSSSSPSGLFFVGVGQQTPQGRQQLAAQGVAPFALEQLDQRRKPLLLERVQVDLAAAAGALLFLAVAEEVVARAGAGRVLDRQAVDAQAPAHLLPPAGPAGTGQRHGKGGGGGGLHRSGRRRHRGGNGQTRSSDDRPGSAGPVAAGQVGTGVGNTRPDLSAGNHRPGAGAHGGSAERLLLAARVTAEPGLGHVAPDLLVDLQGCLRGLGAAGEQQGQAEAKGSEGARGAALAER